MNVHEWTKKYAHCHRRPSRSELLNIHLVLERECVSQEAGGIVSFEETSFRRKGSAAQWYAKRGKPLFVKQVLSSTPTTLALADFQS